MKDIQAVIFDLDGTLIYTLDDLTDSINYTMIKYGYPVYTVAQIQTFVGNGLEKLTECALTCRPKNFDEIFDCFKKHYSKHCNDKTRLYDGVKDMLLEVKKRYKIAIVTNKNELALEALRKIYFDGIVEVVVGQSENLRKKPAPDGVYLALDKLGVKNENAVYVGDSEVDVETAVNSGLPMIACLWGFRTKKLLQNSGAKIFAKKPMDIIKILGNELENE
ncbi:MAG TPA: HAD-IA family hydrolase [Clostridia bacterium]|nr:HAD-IA family hydrolase [Clostridia bacterium]